MGSDVGKERKPTRFLGWATGPQPLREPLGDYVEHALELSHLRVKKVGIQLLILSRGWPRMVPRGY